MLMVAGTGKVALGKTTYWYAYCRRRTVKVRVGNKENDERGRHARC